MPKPTINAKNKGTRLERDLVNFWKQQCVPAKRIVGSGAFRNYSDDLIGDVDLNGIRIECKHRKAGFAQLYGWLDDEGIEMLVVRSDRHPRLYVLPETLMLQFAEKMEWANIRKDPNDI